MFESSLLTSIRCDVKCIPVQQLLQYISGNLVLPSHRLSPVEAVRLVCSKFSNVVKARLECYTRRAGDSKTDNLSKTGQTKDQASDSSHGSLIVSMESIREQLTANLFYSNISRSPRKLGTHSSIFDTPV